jgi:peptidyl-prolyl cis-trans isomerase C
MLSLSVPTSFAGEEDPVLAKAGDYIFRQSDFDRILSFSPQYFIEQLEKNPQQKVNIIKKLVEYKIIADLAREKGFDREKDVQFQLNYMLDNFLATEYLFNIMKKEAQVTPDNVQQYYKENEKQYIVPEQVRARHILIKIPFGATEEEKNKTEIKAKNILEWLKKGEKFETLAKQYSEDTQSGARGGDLGFFPRGKMAKPFEDAAFSMKPGEVSNIVKTDYGYHIIMVEDRREAGKKDLEEVKDGIKTHLQNEREKSKAAEFIKQVSEDTGLEIYSDKIMGK